MLEKAKKQNKVIMYKGKEIPHAVKIPQSDPVDQLCILRETIPVDYVLDFDHTCCTNCGSELVKTTNKEDVKGKLDEDIIEKHEVFFVCNNCHKAFYEGAQTKNIIATYEQLKERLNQKTN